MDEQEMQDLQKSKEESKKGLQDTITQMEKALDLMKEEIEATKALHKITEDYARVLKPEYQFQELDEFWDVVKVLNRIKNERNIMGMESQLRQTEKALKVNKEQLVEMGE